MAPVKPSQRVDASETDRRGSCDTKANEDEIDVLQQPFYDGNLPR